MFAHIEYTQQDPSLTSASGFYRPSLLEYPKERKKLIAASELLKK